jgi:hypothetical protein
VAASLTRAHELSGLRNDLNAKFATTSDNVIYEIKNALKRVNNPAFTSDYIDTCGDFGPKIGTISKKRLIQKSPVEFDRTL